MKTRLSPVLGAIILFVILTASPSPAQVTAFTYQGRLVTNGEPANGGYDFQFRLYDAPTNGSQVPVVPVSANVTVSNGLFMTAMDFGNNVFNGTVYWLEIAVQPRNGAGFTTLSPRQAILPVPGAIFANSASNVLGIVPNAALSGSYSGPISFNNSSNSFSGNGGGLTNVNAARLGGLSADQFWKTTGNAGLTAGASFLGTSDNQPLELKVNGSRALRIEPNTNEAPNIIGGSSVNFVSNDVVGATIAGGGVANSFGLGYTNKVTSSYGTVGGGYSNTAGGTATVAGGAANTASGGYAAVAGGVFNTAGDICATVSGGSQDVANGQFATVAGGQMNTASADHAMVSGGYRNSASGSYSFAAGYRAQAIHQGSFVWADPLTDGDFSSTAANQFSVRAGGGARFVTGGAGMTLDGPFQNSGDISLAGGYHHIELSGGNSSGFLYGSYPYFGDGVHLGYNFYADANGSPHVINAGGGSSRITAGYGEIVLAIGAPGFGPNTVMLHVTSGGVCVNGTVSNCSDRNVKQDFGFVNPSEVLNKIIQLPLSEWSYTNTPAVRHVGPMAQDFYSAFNVGEDDKHIATIDESGVALAAIQGLNQKMETENAALRMENMNLKKRLERLEWLMESKIAKAQ